MNLEQQLIFLFSALGAINGFALSAYFLFLKQDKRLSDYFLGGLLLMLSIRIIKSVFLHFNPKLFELFIQIGLTACTLIGPFLFLYVSSMTRREHQLQKRWWWYVLPFFLLPLYLAYQHPFTGPPNCWSPFVELIYKLWLLCILASAYQLRKVFRKLWQDRKSLSAEEVWLLNIFCGVALIYLAYETGNYTSYIVGALSFSFVFYLSVLLWFYQRSRKPIASDPAVKYANSSLSANDAESYVRKLSERMEAEKLYLDPDLTLAKLSELLGTNRKVLSQAINQVTSANYSKYVARLRVEEAQRLLASPKHRHYKIAAIAYESGFNSLSSFNAAFKTFTGQTPNDYRQHLQQG